MTLRVRVVAISVVSLLMVVLCAVPASAQIFKTIEVSGGYAFMNDTTEEVKFPLGWTVGMAAGLTGWLSVAADADGHYRTLSLVDTEVKLRTHTLMGGLRASARIGPFVEFGQILAGVNHGSGTAFGSTDSVTQFAWQPGGGLDFPLSPHVAARAQLDARFLSLVHEFRFVAGVAYTWRR